MPDWKQQIPLYLLMVMIAVVVLYFANSILPSKGPAGFVVGLVMSFYAVFGIFTVVYFIVGEPDVNTRMALKFAYWHGLGFIVTSAAIFVLSTVAIALWLTAESIGAKLPTGGFTF